MNRDDASIRADELLRDSRWIQAIARSLFFDPHAADDLVQDAWIAALAQQETPRDEAGSARPWLARVLRNLAGKCRRADMRRAARERITARDERLGSTADLVARAETQRLVVEAVLALEEPFRSAVLRAHIEGQTSVEIARALGISDATVRWRIRRGLSQLRFELERRRGREWLGACIGLLGASDRATVLGAWKAATTANVVGGGAKLATASGVALAVCGAGAATWTRFTTPAESSAVVAIADQAHSSSATDAPLVVTAAVECSVAAAAPVDGRTEISKAMRAALGDRVVDELALDDWAEQKLSEVELGVPAFTIASFQSTAAPRMTASARVYVIDPKRARFASGPSASSPAH